ncbi:hypothetical protein [uncultured Alistipes sp.]|jgi:hypothetical protein|uniref:hypothetical protein n=1 Tax=uncultured Alistipes sp. TaxID=538949 RepID=UPI001F9064B9|nr:hypothetical protein [uncultured Alistipes sp.]HJC16756.1 hypothetical protein [Candidatus Alistipes stercorigallinarum]
MLPDNFPAERPVSGLSAVLFSGLGAFPAASGTDAALSRTLFRMNFAGGLCRSEKMLNFAGNKNPRSYVVYQ